MIDPQDPGNRQSVPTTPQWIIGITCKGLPISTNRPEATWHDPGIVAVFYAVTDDDERPGDWSVGVKRDDEGHPPLDISPFLDRLPTKVTTLKEALKAMSLVELEMIDQPIVDDGVTQISHAVNDREIHTRGEYYDATPSEFTDEGKQLPSIPLVRRTFNLLCPVCSNSYSVRAERLVPVLDNLRSLRISEFDLGSLREKLG
jgi:hypothetical protein